MRLSFDLTPHGSPLTFKESPEPAPILLATSNQLSCANITDEEGRGGSATQMQILKRVTSIGCLGGVLPRWCSRDYKADEDAFKVASGSPTWSSHFYALPCLSDWLLISPHPQTPLHSLFLPYLLVVKHNKPLPEPLGKFLLCNPFIPSFYVHMFSFRKHTSALLQEMPWSSRVQSSNIYPTYWRHGFYHGPKRASVLIVYPNTFWTLMFITA